MPRSGGELQEVVRAERSGEPFVHWRDAAGKLTITPLAGEVTRVTIGRSAGADITLAGDSQVSREHARLERVAEGWTLVDDELSTNGSYVNGKRVRARQRLADRDRICLGESDLIYRVATDGGAEETVTVAEVEAVHNLTTMQRKTLVALCRPVYANESATPATNREIADELFCSVDAVKAYLRALFERFGLSDLKQNEKRARLVAIALVSGVVADRDF